MDPGHQLGGEVRDSPKAHLFTELSKDRGNNILKLLPRVPKAQTTYACAEGRCQPAPAQLVMSPGRVQISVVGGCRKVAGPQSGMNQ